MQLTRGIHKTKTNSSMMATENCVYDSTLLGILQNEGKIAPFLDVILGFLYRRTDYFRMMKTETDSLGFPPGVAFKLLTNIFKKYETLAKKAQSQADELRHGREKKEEIKSEQQKTTQLQTPVSQQASQCDNSDQRREEEGLVSAPEQPTQDKVEHTETSSSESKASKSDAADTKNNGDDGDNEDPELVRQRRELQANPLTYNGAERDKYYWSQNITEVDVRVKVPKTVIKGKQVKVDIKTKHIQVSIQESDGSWTKLVDNSLTWDVNKEESMWTLTPGEFVHVNLEKRQERWWENVFTDEEKINTRKIDCSRPMTDLDDEAQAKIEEMMYNQRQKSLGLPQSHEQKTHHLLQKAWDAEGSPFKGQSFDPSKFNVDSNGVVNIKE